MLLYGYGMDMEVMAQGVCLHLFVWGGGEGTQKKNLIKVFAV